MRLFNGLHFSSAGCTQADNCNDSLYPHRLPHARSPYGTFSQHQARGRIQIGPFPESGMCNLAAKAI